MAATQSIQPCICGEDNLVTFNVIIRMGQKEVLSDFVVWPFVHMIVVQQHICKRNKYILRFLGRGFWKYNKVIWRHLHQWSEGGSFLSVRHRAGSWSRDLALNECHWQLLRESEVASALNCVRCDLKSLQSDRFSKKKKKSCYLFLDQSYSLRLITRYRAKYVNKSVILIPFSVTEVWISGDGYPFVFFLL